MVRINAFLARCGVASRRGADMLVRQGRVAVNGQPAHVLGLRVDPDVDVVCLDNHRVLPVSVLQYVLLYKPRGYICSHAPGPKRAQDLIGHMPGLFNVGRLDVDSEGLILFTNDGPLAHRLMHPRYHVEKTYHVWLDKALAKEDKKTLTAGGLVLEEGPCLPARVHTLNKEKTKINMVLREGRRRHIRRVLTVLGYRVLRLKRVAIGALCDFLLVTGHFRHLKAKEVAYLQQVCKLKDGENT